ncbi:E3 ubiquitin-protein ligase TRIM39-like [Lithobates pipiens]
MASLDVTNELNCSVCLSIFTDPVTLECGHNFCRVCINKVLETQGASGVYNCPECRTEFGKCPALQKNINLRNIAERYSGKRQKEEIYCTYCIGSSVPSIQSCLMCEASLCETHLKVHSKSPEHVLCEPISSFNKVKCSTHHQVFMYYCVEDAAHLCASCALSGQHTGHQLELLSDFCKKQKEKLMEVYTELNLVKTDLEKKIQGLELPMKKLESKFETTQEKVSSIFKDIRQQLEKLKERILQDLKAQKKETLNHFVEQISELDAKKRELSEKMDHIKELCSMTNPITALQELDVGSNQILHFESKDQDDLKDCSKTTKEDVDESCFLKMLHKGLSDIFSSYKNKLLSESEAKITLDIQTAANNVFISDDCKTALWQVNQGRPKVPERFQYHQVLSSQAFSSGRHYWEVETGETGNWMVGVAYPNIEREGSQAIIGKNDKSWSLCKWSNLYFTLHNRKQIQLNVKFGCRKFRICLDYEAGRLAFYDLNNLTIPVHTFVTTFTQPLHAAVSVWDSAYVTILSQE